MAVLQYGAQRHEPGGRGARVWIRPEHSAGSPRADRSFLREHDRKISIRVFAVSQRRAVRSAGGTARGRIAGLAGHFQTETRGSLWLVSRGPGGLDDVVPRSQAVGIAGDLLARGRVDPLRQNRGTD